jgi:multicomponent Na+:H+ antiporter subunit E
MQITGDLPRTIVLRWVAYLALWVALIGLDPLDLVVGALAAVVATRVSLRLLPPGSHPARLAALPGLVLRFIVHSVSAGIDVARRAFSPTVPLQPGFFQYRTGYSRGPARNAFASISSLLPGTLAVHDDTRGLLYHCLDVTQPVADELAAQEREVARVFPGASQR